MFEVGQIANPEGRRAEQARDLPFRAALVRRLETTSNPRKLDELADALVKRAQKGEGWALQMIADRLDGKAHQATSNETTYRLTVERIERNIIEPGRLLRSDELPKLELEHAVPVLTDKVDAD